MRGAPFRSVPVYSLLFKLALKKRIGISSMNKIHQNTGRLAHAALIIGTSGFYRRCLLSLSRLSIAACTVFSLAASDVEGSVLFQDNFESYTQGIAPGNPGDGNPNSWGFHANFTTSVIAGASSNGSGQNAQVLHVTNSTPGAYSSFGRSFNRQTNLDEGKVQLQFKLKLTSFNESDYMIDLIDSTVSSISGPIVIRIDYNGNVAIQNGNGGAGGGLLYTYNPQGGVLRLDEWYLFDVQVDLQAQQFRVSITNLDGGNQSGSTGSLYFMTDVKAIDRLLIRPSSTNSNAKIDWLLDDVIVQTIPEPSGTALLGVLLVGGTGRFLGRRFLGL